MVKIMLKGKAKILVPNKRGKTGLIYIPADIVKDSSFPFKPNEEVTVKIEGEKLVIEKRRKEEKDWLKKGEESGKIKNDWRGGRI